MKQILLSKEIEFSEENHRTWSLLFNRQMALVKDNVCKEFIEGVKEFDFNKEGIPDRNEISKKLNSLHRWIIANAENKYLSDEEWFTHLIKNEFPATDFIRKGDELDFTPLPDLFHEFFGHIPFLANKKIMNIIELFALAFKITPKNKKFQVARLWWHTLEFGLIKENGNVKVLGAGLISSNKEFLHALDINRHLPFNIKNIIKTPKSVADVHNKYFILESLDQLEQELKEWIKNHSGK